MGRCPEDGQTVVFESTEEQALTFFDTSIVIAGWPSRLVSISPHLFAVYTSTLDEEFHQNVVDASTAFGEAYWQRVCDESSFEYWQSGTQCSIDAPTGASHRRTRRSYHQQLQNSFFPTARQASATDLWELITEFCWSEKKQLEILFEK